MAVPTFVQRGNSGASDGGNAAVPYPNTFAAGDLICLKLMLGDTVAVPTTPSGWTLLYGPDASGGHRAWVFVKKAVGDESGSLTVTTDAGVGTLVLGCMYAFRGWSDTGTITDAFEGAAVSTGGDASVEHPDLTTAGTDRLGVAFVTVDDDNALDPFTGQSGGTWGEPTPSITTTISNDGAIQLQTVDMASAGTVSGGSTTMAAADPWVCRVFAIKPDAATQSLAPSADSADGAWTDDAAGTALASAIDEDVPSDIDYIQSEIDPSNSGCRVKLAAGMDPASSTGHVIRWRIRKDTTGGSVINMTVKLIQGGGDVLGAGTVIASFDRTNVSDSFQTFEETLSGAQADAITDYSDLYLEFYADTA